MRELPQGNFSSTIVTLCGTCQVLNTNACHGKTFLRGQNLPKTWQVRLERSDLTNRLIIELLRGLNEIPLYCVVRVKVNLCF